jgi:hypothetical protein
MPLEWTATAAFGFMLGILAHAAGWPIVAGGSQCFADALASYLRSLGGEIITGHFVRSLAELPPAAAATCASRRTPKSLATPTTRPTCR